ncbi:MAG: hypothetical protein WAW11_03525 [Patescibacteria group bacterium]
MIETERIIESYQKVLAFNQKALEVSNKYQEVLNKKKRTGLYDKDYLLDSKPLHIPAKINYNHENKDIIFDKAEIYYCLETYPELYYLGFSLILLLKSQKISYHLKIATTRTEREKFSPISFSKGNLTITQESDSYRNSIVIRFSSRKQMKEITDFCNQIISDFNQTLEKEEKLIKNLKNL